MVTLSYLAYGSNFHPMRLMERVPSASLIGTVKMPGYQLTFNKRGKDGSGKCNLLWPGDAGSSVFCAIYDIDAKEKPELDKAESKGFGYFETQITVTLNNIEYSCFAYLAQQSHIAANLKPYHWYKELVVLGARHLDFPSQYLESIISVESEQDFDIERRQANEVLLQRIRELR